MTEEELIDMARQAGFRVGPSRDGPDDVWGVGANLKRFAKLVAEKEREAYIAHAMTSAEKAIDVAIKLEREACAKLCESMGVYPELNVWNGGPDWYKRQKECAKAIRERGDKNE